MSSETAPEMPPASSAGAPETSTSNSTSAGANNNNSSSSNNNPPGADAGFHSASLYVGDIANEVNEGLLFEIFNAVGPVSSIRVCRDAVTRRSLGYAYVNFHQLPDAERALDTMNFTDIKGKPCRIMWSQRDPSLRRSGVGNIFVKNLQESIDNKQLYDTFSLFGNILSCKVVQDRESGTSKGYGYIHYETAEAAHAAIEKLDGMLIDGQEVQVGEFMRRNERPGQSDWTNCYVKNIPYSWDDAKLFEEFSKFGEVVSAAISMGIPKRKAKKKAAVKPEDAAVEGEKKEGEEPPAEPEADAAEPVEEPSSEDEEKEEEAADPVEDGKEKKVQSLGFGFVNFLDHESALAAVETLNGTEVDGVIDGEPGKQELYVGRAQKKTERERELRAKFEAQKMDRISKFQGVNLYVKNLDDSVTDDMLRDEFSAMGTITSARVMRDIKADRSRGFGFVCYSTPEEATRAVNEMNGKLMANKPIFVALAQRREVRRAQLEAQHAQRGGAPGQQMMRGGPINAGFPPGSMPMYIQRPQPSGSMQPSYPMMPQMMGGPGRGGTGGPQMMGTLGRGVLQQSQRPYSMPGGYAQQGGRGRGGQIPGGRGGRGRGQVPGGRGAAPAQGRGQPGIKFNPQVRNAGPANTPAVPQQVGAPQQPEAGAPPATHEPLTAAALASAPPDVQKNMIGERLYPLIHNSQPELAGKITGMLLEMDNSELLHLLESPDALNHKITEALQVLEAHNQNSTTD